MFSFACILESGRSLFTQEYLPHHYKHIILHSSEAPAPQSKCLGGILHLFIIYTCCSVVCSLYLSSEVFSIHDGTGHCELLLITDLFGHAFSPWKFVRVVSESDVALVSV